MTPRIGQDGAARSPARGPGRPPVPPERVIRAALELVDEQGADALTLRALAARLNSGTATLYRHFGGRDDLARHVVDAVFAEIVLDDELLAAADWDLCVLHITEQLFAAMVRHRNVAPLMLQQLPTGPHALRLRERCLGVLLANGFDERRAVQTYATLARFVLGFGIQLRSEFESAPGPDAAVGRIPLAEEFAFGLELMITGLRHS